MKITAIAFTQNGADTAKKLTETIGAEGYLFSKYTVEGLKSFDSLADLVGVIFKKGDAIVFVGACGIAVRAIAPYIKNKTIDPAVLVVDERCGYVIPILSGHIGGANELAEKIADMTGATAVITTATDINGKFAVDVFAVKNNLLIVNMEMAKLISSELLQGHKIGLYSDFELKNVPDCFSENAEIGICVSYNGKKKPFVKTLNLIPKNIVLGVGCRKGTADITKFANEFLAKHKISREAVCIIASIDIKKTEPAIIRLADELKAQLRTYTASELMEQNGDFTVSEFVKNTVGADNVCERSTVAAGAKLIVKKTAKDGVTLAMGTIKSEINFEKGH